ncbi:MAG TPA: hypothetical protein VJ866_08595 [Pyrinomonadaceae bacterium]|nr:hypothetical protein [Pyrinomonadaceae bacterium]
MSYKDHEKLSEGDFESFGLFLTEHYRQPLEESYESLRRAIWKLLEGTDTNRRYRPQMLTTDVDDMISAVTYRLISIYSQLRRKGEPLLDLNKMLRKIVYFVHREELRELRPSAPPRPDGPDVSDPPLPQPVEGVVSGVEREIEHDCYDECLGKLPEHIQELFLSYYPDSRVEPKELVAQRRRLAGEADGEHTLKSSERKLNNLQVKVNKWRIGRLEDCMRRCAEARRDSHVGLEYLKQQRGK